MARMNGPPASSSDSTADCFSCQWRDRSQWCVLDHEDIRVLNEAKACSLYQPGKLIFNQGDPCSGVYCIENGTVAIRKTDEHGNSVLVRLRHAGEAIGYRDFFSGNGHSTSAEAVAPSTICFVERVAVQDLLGRNPALGLRFMLRVAEDLDDAEETILQNASFAIRTRLAHLLLALKERYATVDDHGVMTIRLPLARQDIASILGSRPETIARTIHGLETDGVARFSGRNVIVDDLDLLLDEIEPEHQP